MRHGLHLTADLCGCSPHTAAMTDPDALRALCHHAIATAGLLAVGELFHHFPAPGGVTGVVLLAESHLAVHTWPELGAVMLDIHVCNRSADHGERAKTALMLLEQAFEPASVHRQQLQRRLGEAVSWPAPDAPGAGARTGSAR
ncbi:MAG: adenosylmethionine decarboxylase [Rubrivivax sp.]